LNVSFEGVEGESLVTSLPELALSTGSACNSASEEPSYVLRALGRDTQLAQSSLRFSIGRLTSESDIDLAVKAVRREIERLRALSPASEDAEGANSALRAPERQNSRGAGGAGDVGETITISGEAGSRGDETWIRFHLDVAGDTVKAARFKAYGCPHTLRVAQWLTDRLPGRKRSEGIPGTPAQWAEELGVPVDRLGRLLVVEDALRACGLGPRPAI